MAKKKPAPPHPLRELGLEAETLKRLGDAYGDAWGLPLLPVAIDGRILHGDAPCKDGGCLSCNEARAAAVQEALRWGEPTIAWCPKRHLLWAVPLMQNERLLGGLVAHATEKAVFAGTGKRPPLDVRAACTDLRQRVEAENLTNASALRLQREQYRREQTRAYALHHYKESGHESIRELYLQEEPALFSAIRSSDRQAARQILNRILVAIHHHAGNRIGLIKSFFLELVVSMCRSAVDAGGDPQELLGENFQCMTELASIDSDEALAPWLARTLERLMDAIEVNRRKDPGTVLFDALAYMERHLGEKIGRDDVAQAVHLSPSHFSHLVRKESGVSFTDLLNRMRVDRAAELLRRTDKPLSLIALESGFQDQSYFTKVFKKFRHAAPRRFRQEHGKKEE